MHITELPDIVNGDGNGDLLHVSTSGSRETVTTYLHSTTGRANLVRGVRNGLGAVTDIIYESLSTTDSYVRIAKLHSTPAEERCFDWQPGPGVCWLGLAGGGGMVLASLTLTSPVHGYIAARGFTGHEMLDAVGIIHMNGRIYDPKLGRFMQADPASTGEKYGLSGHSAINNPGFASGLYYQIFPYSFR